MLWVLGLVLLLALLIPLAAVLLDVPRRRQSPEEAPALPPQDDRVSTLARRLLALEDDVETVARGLQDLRDEIDVLQHRLESGRPPESTDRRGDPHR